MKKIMLFVLLIGVIVFMACGKNEEFAEVQNEKITESPAENQFDATVVEINDEYLMVKALDGQSIAGEVHVWTGLLSEDEIPEIAVGDTVRITHDGKMTMSLPPQMSATEAILLMEKK